MFDFNGKYLAQIKDERLITVLSNKCKIASAHAKPINAISRNYCNIIGNVMLSGCEDFYWPE